MKWHCRALRHWCLAGMVLGWSAPGLGQDSVVGGSLPGRMPGAPVDGTYLDAMSEGPPTPSGTGAERQVTFLEQWKHCEGFFRANRLHAQLEDCMRVAGQLLEKGTRLQEGRWKPLQERQEAVLVALKKLRERLEKATVREFESVGEDLKLARQSASWLVAVEKGQFSLVSQGGISYGAWQAGFALFLTEWVHLVRDYQRQLAAPTPPSTSTAPVFSGFSSVTGASAGAVNGLAVALASCRTHSLEPPAESLFYRVWIESLGLFGRHGQRGLFPTSKTKRNALGMFDDRALDPLAMGHAQREMSAPHFIPNCVSDLGFAVTHLDAKARTVHADEGGRPVIVRSSLREKFVVRLQSTPDGVLGVRNIDPSGTSRTFYAGLGGNDVVSAQTLRDAVRASGAFPVAFPPVEDLLYTWYGLNGSKQVKPGTFVDGGTFDNTPIGVAIDLNRWQAEAAAGRPQAEAAADGPQGNPYLRELLDEAPATYYFLEPNVTPWALEQAVEKEKSGTPTNVLSAISSFAGDFVSSSFDAEFLDNARSNPFVLYAKQDWVGPRLSVPVRHMPIAGEQLAHFNAFLEHDFRDFDFYAGMADAYEFVKKEEAVFQRSGFALGVAAKLRTRYEAVDPRYGCLSEYYDRTVARKTTVTDVEPWVTAITSFQQLPPRCRALTVTRDGPESGNRAVDKDDVIMAGYANQVAGHLAPGADEAAARRSDRQHPVARHNFLTMLVAMHNYHGWLRRAGKGVHSPKKFYDALAGSSFADDLAQPNAPRGDGILQGPGFVYVDLQGSDYVSDLQPHVDEVWAAVRWLAHDGVDHLASSQDGLLTKASLHLASRPALDSALDVKLWPGHAWGIGLGHSLEGFYGHRLYYGLRLDLGLHALTLSRSMLQPDDVKEAFWAAEGFGRFLLQDLFPSLPFELDPFAGYSGGVVNTKQRLAHGPLLGLRFTLMSRLSLAVEGKQRWAPKAVTGARDAWKQVNTYFTLQLF
jgi:predicted acylesterase/phospholipase RssA